MAIEIRKLRNNMKKFVTSFVVIISFGIYALLQRNVASSVVVVAPKISTNTNTLTDQSGSIPISANSLTPPTTTTPTPAKTTTPTPKPTPTPTPTPTPAPAPKPQGQYKDGQYTGSVADAYYGNIQVRATISGGKLTNVIFLQYPSDRSTSIAINSQAMPYLKQEAIAAQSANVDIVSGATDSSTAFQQSLGSALAQAKI